MIKTKVTIFSNVYYTILEMTQNLEIIFCKFDKVAKLNALLYNPRFEIAILNLKEIFDEFLACFTSTITLFNFTNWYKISNFQWILS